MEERGHILNVLKGVSSALKNKNYLKIKTLSNQLVHQASINQDPSIISLAVIIYALSKIIERENYKEYRNWPVFYKNYILSLNNLIEYLEKEDIDRFHNEIHSIRKSIAKLSGNLKIYISEVFRRAEVNKASRIYEHGISMQKTAKILGISLWELSEYAGKTRISDINWSITLPIEKRIKIAEEIFK